MRVSSVLAIFLLRPLNPRNIIPFMKRMAPKKMRKLALKPAVKKSPTKTKKRLSKSDPDYYSKIGKISARKRGMTSEEFSAMASLSHPRKEYKGGRPKKDSE